MSQFKYDIRSGVKKIKTKTALSISALTLGLAGLGMAVAIPVISHADTTGTDFESYSTGTVNGQDGWSSLGSAGSGCALYDHAIVNNSGAPAAFGTKSLRISNAVTSGCFSDQTFSKSLADEAGETSAVSNGLSGGTRQTYFVGQFDLASTVPGAQQSGLSMSVSPDRGDGARMSYLRFEDQADGVHAFFSEYKDVAPLGTFIGDPSGCSGSDNFVETDVATLDRSLPHTIKFAMHFVDGQGNDVVKIYIDGNLVKTGTSWEDYFRFCEGNPTRPVDSLLFRTGGTAAPTTAGNGYLVDNLNLQSLSNPAVSTPSITSPANNSTQTSAQLVKIDWTDSTGTFIPPVMYQYRAFSDPGYTSLVYDSGPVLTASEIPTPGTPNGNYYVQVRAIDTFGNQSAWSNDAVNPYKITVADSAPLLPTSKDQCMNNGWKTYGSTFKNQGDCVSFVATNGKNQPNGPAKH